MKNKNHHQHFEKRVAVFGAGQAGRMVCRWLPAGTEFTCYIDNAADRQGTYLDGIPVRSLEESLCDDPDLIIIAVLNKEAEGEIYRQIRQTGYMGRLILTDTPFHVISKKTDPQHFRHIALAIKDRKMAPRTALLFLEYVEENIAKYTKPIYEKNHM